MNCKTKLTFFPFTRNWFLTNRIALLTLMTTINNIEDRAIKVFLIESR